MTKHKLCTAEIAITTDDQVNSALDCTAGRFFDSYTVVSSYIQNALSAAKEILQGGEAGRYDIEIKINYDSGTGDVSVLDNCSGMDVDCLKGVCEKVFSSKKAGIDKAGGGSGFGIHAFRSCFKEAAIKTKTRGGKVLELTLRRGVEHLRDNIIYELQGEDAEFPYASGTLVRLSGFDPRWAKSPRISFEGLCEYVRKRYPLARKNPRLKLIVLKDWSEETADEGPKNLFEISRSIKLR